MGHVGTVYQFSLLSWYQNNAAQSYCEHVAMIFVAKWVTIAIVWHAKIPLILALCMWLHFNNGNMKPINKVQLLEKSKKKILGFRANINFEKFKLYLWLGSFFDTLILKSID